MLRRTTAATTPAAPVATNPYQPDPLVPGSVEARVVRDVWAGSEDVVVKSPPGSGKTHLVVQTASHLISGTDEQITILTPTRAQGAALLHRLAAKIEPSLINNGISALKTTELPAGIRRTKSTEPRISVRTLASGSFDPPRTGLVVVDEAYQATFADVDTATARAGQVLLVGDPGQIGPVVTIDTSPWETRRTPPHWPAPKVLEQSGKAKIHQLPNTRRLGAITTNIIAPLYDFEFGSLRPDRHLSIGSDAEPEISLITISPDANEAQQVEACVSRAWKLYHARNDDGSDSSVAIVLSRNSQVAMATAMLRSRQMHDHIIVGTADRLQGGEWDAVVALDPVVNGSFSQHSLSLGRLCVMLSRHKRHLTWIQDGTWRDALESFGSTAKTHSSVRRLLLAA